jgi:hypothetical protein
MWTPHSAASAVHPNRRNGSAHVPAGTSQRAQRLNAILNRSSRGADAPVEEGAGHDLKLSHCQIASVRRMRRDVPAGT